MLTLLPVLIACHAAGNPDTTDTNDTTDTDMSDTTDTDVSAVTWPDPIPACDGLAQAFPMADVADLQVAWGLRPRLDVVNSVMSRVTDANTATGCPSLVVDTCNTGVTFTGECASGPITATGTAVNDGCDDGGAWHWSGFSISSTDPTWSFSAEGSAGASMSGSVYEGFEVTATLHHACGDAACSGTYTWSGTHVVAQSETRSERVSAAPEDGDRSGDYCIDEALDKVEGCGNEGVGWTVLHGDHVAVVLWDGDVACDGCGSLFIDGVASGQWCR